MIQLACQLGDTDSTQYRANRHSIRHSAHTVAFKPFPATSYPFRFMTQISASRKGISQTLIKIFRVSVKNHTLQLHKQKVPKF
jgi:hypothetical protein